MKRSIITFLLLFGIFSLVGFIVAPSVTQAQSVEEDQPIACINGGWESFSQTMSVDNSYFYGKYQNTIYGKDAMGFHLRPVWKQDRYEAQFDFGIYQNPWVDSGNWQWGQPMPVIKPELPNFIDTFSYQGKGWDLKYQKVSDLNFGYGLMINDYHPTHPYHGWTLVITPTDSTELTVVSSQEIHYFVPFVSNDYASMQLFRLDQSLETAGLKLQLGLTGIHEDYASLTSSQFPTGGNEYDVTLTNLIWLSPFIESGSFNHLGTATMLGITGKLGLVGYQIGDYQARGKFSPNYFGGRYEDLKWNSLVSNGQPGLPDLNFSDDSTREGSISQVWVKVNPWLNIGCLNIDDIEDITGYSLSGNIERLGLEYGFFYYNQRWDVYNYDWFIRGGNGFYRCEYHYYSDWDRNVRSDFEVSFKF